MTNLMKKWKKLIAGIVLAAFFFQTGPVYAFDLLQVNSGILSSAVESNIPEEENSVSTEKNVDSMVTSLSADENIGTDGETAPSVAEEINESEIAMSSTEETSLPDLDIFAQQENLNLSSEEPSSLSDGTVAAEPVINGELEELREP